MNSSSSSRVIAIGAIHYDTIAHAFEAIRPETSTPARFSSRPGGVATNIARALVRLGVPTSLAGTLGDDAAAGSLTAQLEAEGLELNCVTRRGFATGQYLALHNPDGSLTAACVDDRVLSEAPEDLFDPILAALAPKADPDTIWFLDANLPERMIARITDGIGKGRLIANAVSDAKAPRLKAVLDKLDCLMLNRGEAAALTGLPPGSPLQDLASALARTGLKRFVLTAGDDDVLVLNAGRIDTFAPRKVDVVDVTGAGDALTAATIAALTRGHSLTEAIPYGLSAAALTLSSTGALAEGLSWQAISSF